MQFLEVDSTPSNIYQVLYNAVGSVWVRADSKDAAIARAKEVSSLYSSIVTCIGPLPEYYDDGSITIY